MNSILNFIQQEKKVFNTTVDNTVEKPDRIAVSGSARDGSAFCTGAGAGTFVVLRRAAVDIWYVFCVPSNCENQSR
jgi:hypothetical protein